MNIVLAVAGCLWVLLAIVVACTQRGYDVTPDEPYRDE